MNNFDLEKYFNLTHVATALTIIAFVLVVTVLRRNLRK